MVFLEGVGEVEIKKETWLKRDRNGQKVGSVTQYPIVYCCSLLAQICVWADLRGCFQSQIPSTHPDCEF